MNEHMRRYPGYFLSIARIFVGGVFIYSGWEKLMTPVQNFSAVIEGYGILPPQFVLPVAFLFPWLEIIFGTFLFLGFITRLSAGTLAFFSFLFIIILSRSLLLHQPVTECGCFGAGITLSPKQALTLDSGLFILALALFRKPPSFLSLDKWLRR